MCVSMAEANASRAGRKLRMNWMNGGIRPGLRMRKVSRANGLGRWRSKSNQLAKGTGRSEPAVSLMARIAIIGTPASWQMVAMEAVSISTAWAALSW